MAFGRRKNNPGPTADETPVDTPEPTTEAANGSDDSERPDGPFDIEDFDSAEDAATAAAGAAVVGAFVRIVETRRAVPADHYHPREVRRQADIAERTFNDVGHFGN